MFTKNHVPKELDELATQIGNFIYFWGFKKIHGRIWIHLFLSQAPLDAGTLMKRLKVSKALMSLSLHDLLDNKVILEAGKSSKGTMTYQANEEVLSVIVEVLRAREQKLIGNIETAFTALKKLQESDTGCMPLCARKFRYLENLIGLAQTTLASVLAVGTAELSAWEKTLHE